MDGNADATLDRLAQLLAGEGDVVLAIAFGSLVAGSADSGSDVDVGVWTDPALDHERKRDLTRAIALATGRPVDLVDLRSAGVALRREIFCRGRKLVDRDPSLRAHLIVRMLGDVEDFLPYVERIHRERRERWTR
ncbi:MAG: nucleotidyltransferase domain-containing protein [Trueperaceae bacterium]|nr:nucleotidyltransferase domain-containing protein [Trueperaceae bacterium]